MGRDVAKVVSAPQQSLNNRWQSYLSPEVKGNMARVWSGAGVWRSADDDGIDDNAIRAAGKKPGIAIAMPGFSCIYS